MRVAASPLCRLLRSAKGETTTGWSALLARGFKRESLADIETLPLEKEPYCRQRTELVLGDRVPVLAPDAFVAPSAVLVGDVDVYNRVSIWDGCVLRGDLNRIRVMHFSNIQDRTVIHAARSSPTGLSAATTIGEYVTVGPGCVIRSCKIGDRCIIGERSVLMEGSVIEKDVILEAGTVLPPGKYIPSGEVWGGNPARFIRKCTNDEIDDIVPTAEKAFELNYRHNLEYLPHGTAWRKAQKLREECFWGDVSVVVFYSCGTHGRCCLFGCKTRWNHSVVTFFCDMFRRGGQTTAINTATHRILQTAFPGQSTHADMQILHNVLMRRRDAIARGIRTRQSKN